MKRCQTKLLVINYIVPIAKPLQYWKHRNKFIFFNKSQDFHFENNLVRKWMQTSHKIPKIRRHEKYGEKEALNRQHALSCSFCPTSAALTPFWFPLTFPFLCSLNVFYLPQQMISTVWLWLKPHDWLAVSPPCPSGLQIMIYLLLKVCKKQTCFIQTLKNKDLNTTHWGIWGKRGEGWSNMPTTFLAVNRFGQLQLLYILLQENHILCESFSLLQQSIDDLTAGTPGMHCSISCARRAFFLSSPGINSTSTSAPSSKCPLSRAPRPGCLRTLFRAHWHKSPRKTSHVLGLYHLEISN